MLRLVQRQIVAALRPEQPGDVDTSVLRRVKLSGNRLASGDRILDELQQHEAIAESLNGGGEEVSLNDRQTTGGGDIPIGRPYPKWCEYFGKARRRAVG